MTTLLLLLSLTLLLASPVASSPPPSPPSLSFVTSVAAQGATPAASVGVSHASANACAELPYCMAIAGRDCGWCFYTNTSMPGNVFAPTPPGMCYSTLTRPLPPLLTPLPHLHSQVSIPVLGWQRGSVPDLYQLHCGP